jgi:prepilin-type N-terminal cleavage/methylation domain-containing protein
MKNRKAFTLIELMIVLFIIGVLAAIAIPYMRGRVDSAKWSEGQASAGSIHTAARAFMGEKGPTWGGDWTTVTLTTLGFEPGDLTGKYFTDAAYAISVTAYDTYTITVTAANSASPDRPTIPAVITLDNNGSWTIDGVAE